MANRTDPVVLQQLRTAIARLERPETAPHVLPFGLPALDSVLPQGGLVAGFHEVTGAGADVAQGAAAGLFAAGILARLPGPVLWVLEQDDVFAPGLAGAGLHPDRVIYAHVGKEGAGKAGLLVMEEGLRHGRHALAGVVAEVSGRLSLTASRRLQLAAESTGALALVLRRQHTLPEMGQETETTAALTRWRVTALPSGPAVPDVPDIPGVGRGAWQIELLRNRGGQTGTWIVGACDAAGRLDMVSPLAHRPAAALGWRAA